MNDYDVLIAGGGIAGSLAAKLAAEGGLRTLFIERHKTPRNKPCSGIQFEYFAKIIGEPFPPERLCTNQLTRTSFTFPNGQTQIAPFKMFNFMRDTFDDWLNQLAISSGAEFRDGVQCTDFNTHKDSTEVSLTDKEGQASIVHAKYVVDATGLRPFFRRKLRPQDFHKGSSAGTLNYYIRGDDGDLDPETLYQVWNLDFNNRMFAWIYKKSDLWVVGTGHDTEIRKHQDLFLQYVQDTYHLEGEIVRREGFTSSIDFDHDNQVWLGQDRLLVTGDAAGLLDPTRGVGMDAAAMSGRLAAKAILDSEESGRPVLSLYTQYMRKIVKQTLGNQKKGIHQFTSNDELQRHLKKSMLKMGVNLMLQSFLNRYRSAETQTLIP